MSLLVVEVRPLTHLTSKASYIFLPLLCEFCKGEWSPLVALELQIWNNG